MYFLKLSSSNKEKCISFTALALNRAEQREVSTQLAHDSCSLGITDWFEWWIWCLSDQEKKLHFIFNIKNKTKQKTSHTLLFWGNQWDVVFLIDAICTTENQCNFDFRYRGVCFSPSKQCDKQNKLWKTWGKQSSLFALAVYLIAPVNCACNSQISGSPFVFSQLHQTPLQQAKPSIISPQTMCLDTLPCRHIDGHFLRIPRAERIDSTSIHVWTAGESSRHSLAAQTDSQYSQVWKAGPNWATGQRASGGAEPDWLSWYPISWEVSWVTSELW